MSGCKGEVLKLLELDGVLPEEHSMVTRLLRTARVKS